MWRVLVASYQRYEATTNFRAHIYIQTHTSCTSRGSGLRIHCGVKVTELSTNKQHWSLRDKLVFFVIMMHKMHKGIARVLWHSSESWTPQTAPCPRLRRWAGARPSPSPPQCPFRPSLGVGTFTKLRRVSIGLLFLGRKGRAKMRNLNMCAQDGLYVEFDTWTRGR